jgi:hypothetical protein
MPTTSTSWSRSCAARHEHRSRRVLSGGPLKWQATPGYRWWAHHARSTPGELHQSNTHVVLLGEDGADEPKDGGVHRLRPAGYPCRGRMPLT